MPAKQSEFSMGWRVLCAGLIGVACGASPIPFNTIGQFIGPLHKEFGWAFGAISLGVTIFGVLAAGLAPLFGSWADTYGVRRVALWSLAAFGLAFACFALITPSIASFYGVWVLVGLVGIGSTPVTFSRAVNMWFVDQRGLALGILLLGTSLAGFVVPPLTVWLIEAHGWRTAYVGIALLPLLVALPMGLLLFREPREEERPAGLKIGNAIAGVTRSAAMADYRFWLLFASIACIALGYGGAHIHFKEMMVMHGFTANVKTGLVLLAFGILAGRVLTGLALDRFWAPAVCFPILCAPIVSCWLLANHEISLHSIYLAAFLLGFAAGAESDLIAYLTGRYFGMAHYGKIYGWLYLPFGMGSAISPFLYGKARDMTGLYDVMLYVAMGLFFTGACLLLLLGKYPDFKARFATT